MYVACIHATLSLELDSNFKVQIGVGKVQ